MSLFQITQECDSTKARTGSLTLDRGDIQTPIFMPIGTAGSVKSVTAFELNQIGFPIILGNTYHLWIRPGLGVFGGDDKLGVVDKKINEAQNHKKTESSEILTQDSFDNTLLNPKLDSERPDIHEFTSWSKPILTDSGGFQAWSLDKMRKFTEDGVTFAVQGSGQKRFLSPEISMQIQNVLNSDITLVLDEALDAQVSEKEARRAMMRTRRWAERSQNEWQRLQQQKAEQKNLSISQRIDQQLLFGIPQGAQFIHLREESARLTMELDFPGYSIGGVANGGEPEEIMYQQVQAQTNILEKQKPRHLLGVGTPRDIVRMVACGIDMFDCVYPTRNARHGSLIMELDESHYEIVQISSRRYIYDFQPINSTSVFPELRTYTKAYLCHLFRAKELLAYRLATLQNLEFYYNLMAQIRRRIKDGSFKTWYSGYDRGQS